MTHGPDTAKIAGYIGLAVRAGQAVSGETACVSAIRAGKAAVALLDEAAAGNAQKRFSDTCSHYQVPLMYLPPGLLGKAAGKPGRMALVLPPGGLAEKVLAQMEAGTENG